MHFRNLFLSTSLVMMLGLLLIAVFDPLMGSGKSVKARVISSDDESSTIALPDGSIARVAVGNLKKDSRVKVTAKQRLFSRLSVYKLRESKPTTQQKASIR
ncbi:hypothetical protein L2719_20225 [Shewanella schlegeliana]|uniref:Uncharacterized protein n=1 Tax=Shewanella schlegeliana TaxID=190308 RepID=A0ABS1T4E7_9GAMM|nr:hypothetical protein [Shewanella schlegeliana]MBL4915579.1 hypothetical protein [Shewanella schlegeliana]MCL1111854.1 hypothetical protein [Shewanella schlegeliana]GIU37610.1 hypothetical protein TUM4433_38090 [Shewanella schlegeliana]